MDREADFSDFVSSSRRRLVRTAFLLCGDWHLAEDAVQSALTKLYIAWPRVEARRGPDADVNAILLRTVIDERRRPWRREVSAGTLLLDGDSAADRPPTVTAGLREAVLALPLRQRQVIVIRYFADYSIEETAAVLNISAGSVKSHSARGMRRLHQLLNSPMKPTATATAREACR